MVAAGVTDGAAGGAVTKDGAGGVTGVEAVVAKGATLYAPVIIFAVAAICVE